MNFTCEEEQEEQQQQQQELKRISNPAAQGKNKVGKVGKVLWKIPKISVNSLQWWVQLFLMNFVCNTSKAN